MIFVQRKKATQTLTITCVSLRLGSVPFLSEPTIRTDHLLMMYLVYMSDRIYVLQKIKVMIRSKNTQNCEINENNGAISILRLQLFVDSYQQQLLLLSTYRVECRQTSAERRHHPTLQWNLLWIARTAMTWIDSHRHSRWEKESLINSHSEICSIYFWSLTLSNVAIVVAFKSLRSKLWNPSMELLLAPRKATFSASEIKPIMYGLPASPNACEIRIWKASAVDRLVGITTYWMRKK